MIVKPANLGSSVGIKIAKDRASLSSAIENAAGYASKILVEKAITNLREINCSVLGDSDGTKASVCEEPVGGDEILSYKDKYLSGGKSAKSQGMNSLKKRLPADLAEDTTEKIRQMAQDTFLAIGAAGVSRIDFMIDEDTGEVFVNEINTIPGSLSFSLWEATGLSFAGLTDQLITLALKRQRQRDNLIFSYDTNILSANSLTNLKNHK